MFSFMELCPPASQREVEARLRRGDQAVAVEGEQGGTILPLSFHSSPSTEKRRDWPAAIPVAPSYPSITGTACTAAISMRT